MDGLETKKEPYRSHKKHTFLYIGGFELPNKNAAAHRVVGIAKAIRELGHEVCFLNYTDSVTIPAWNKHFDFACFEAPKRKLTKQITDISDVVKIVCERQIDGILMYNYPAIAMSRLLKWCKKRNIKCYADATEWYMAGGRSIYSLIKNWDSKKRMKKLHLKTDGVIAISDFLYQYYKDKVRTVKIPPTVDIYEPKWSTSTPKETEQCVFVYAGSPSAQKECLDKIVDAVEKTQHPAVLQIIGITQEQYESMYQTRYHGTKTNFLGHMEHAAVIDLVKKANWSVIIREDNQVVKAGFPTKLVESISCGTPIVANRFSNIVDYLNESNSILCSFDAIGTAIDKACQKNVAVDNKTFHYEHYLQEMRALIE